MTSNIQIDPKLLVDLADSALSADYSKTRRVLAEVARNCASQGESALAKQLASLARRKGTPLQTSGAQDMLPVDGVSRLPLIDEEPWPTKPVILNAAVQATITRFIDDVRNAQILLEKGLLTRFGLMLSGPPGTGKTLLAGHIAAQLGRPFFVVRLDSLISSRLGETAKNIRQIFDFAPAKRAVLLLDEIDAIAKMRDDKQELGELKRVVNTVIQGLDSLDDQAVVIAATNHSQLLDPAIWRRFPYQADIGLPGIEARESLWLHFLYEDNPAWEKRAAVFSRISDGFSGADIENLALATRRLSALNDIELPEAQLAFAISESTPPTIFFPQTQPLTRDQKKSALLRLAQQRDVVQTELFKILDIPRTTAIRNLKDEPHA